MIVNYKYFIHLLSTTALCVGYCLFSCDQHQTKRSVQRIFYLKMDIFKIKLVIAVEYQSQHRNAFDGGANINMVCIA